ncbi:MAG: hypothetical protein EOO30_19615 [Comamonadaceae bacterium]|nr:MAG: hypothetical protein EOO30_19615 [Comamonadaceae bacterium]
MRPISQFTETLRASFSRRRLEHQLMQAVARLPHEPESRCAYQHLLEEHMRRAEADKPGAPREKVRG